MSYGRTRSVVISGIRGTLVEVEAHVASGLPRVTIAGLPDTGVSQSPNRIRAAMGQCGLDFPDTRLTLNLSPGSVPKRGSALDLALAVAILATGSVLDVAEVGPVVHLGELGMDGSVRAVPGILPAVMEVAAAGADEVVVPAENAEEAALVDGVTVRPVRTLSDVVAFHRARARGEAFELPWPPTAPVTAADTGPDLADVVGQYEARAALEVAAAGGHHLAMVGPPGAGKSMLAERLPGLLPPLSRADALAATSIASVLGQLRGRPLIDRAPFVAPHHSTTMPALVGGGVGAPKPGAISQAHAGVLFLDEAPEFKTEVMNALRQPLECGFVNVARAERTLRFPSRFQLILASNPCPCGRFVGSGAACTCTADARRKYAHRLSGPVLDRVDVHLQVPAITRSDLLSGPGESTAVVGARVAEARERSRHRWRHLSLSTNAQVPGAVLRSTTWAPGPNVTRQLDTALDAAAISLRGYDRTLRLAWTLSDLAGRPHPTRDDLHAALTLRDAEVGTGR